MSDDEHDDDEKLNKAERLAIAGKVAPTLRAASERTRTRRVTIVDKDGKVTGYTTLAEVQKKQLERAKIEVEMAGGKRPAAIVCRECGTMAMVAKRGYRRSQCRACSLRNCHDCGVKIKKGRGSRRCAPCDRLRATKNAYPTLSCVVCGKQLSRSASSPSHKARAEGRPPKCSSCVRRKWPRLKCSKCSRECGSTTARELGEKGRATYTCSKCL